MDDQNRISIVHADITTLHVDAIVNAANNTLLGGGGVDGAIHKAAGTKLLDECRLLHGCATGEAKLTKGYNLPANFVIHTVGPIWHGGHNHEAEKLKACYENSLHLATQHSFKTIAFSAISTGVYRYPAIAATKIAVATVLQYLKENASPHKVIFCCYSDDMEHIYQSVLHDFTQVNDNL